MVLYAKRGVTKNINIHTACTISYINDKEKNSVNWEKTLGMPLSKYFRTYNT